MDVEPSALPGEGSPDAAGVALTASFDPSAVVARYSGDALTNRASHALTCLASNRSVAARVSPTALVPLVAAAVAAVQSAEADATLYSQVIDAAHSIGVPGISKDASWISRITRQSELRLISIERDLNVQRANSHRDNSRKGYLELAAAQRAAGKFADSLRSLMTAREYAVNPKQLIDINLTAAEGALLARTSNAVFACLGRPDVAAEASSSQTTGAQVAAWTGTAHLIDGSYESAAQAFLAINPTQLSLPNSLVHVEDIALYAAITATATYSREGLKAALGKRGGSAILECLPAARQLVADFVAAKYANVLAALAEFQVVLQLDYFAAAQTPSLTHLIRSRVFELYLLPFSSVNLRTMAEALHIPLKELEPEVAALIGRQVVSAKLDADAKVLYSHKAEPRIQTLTKAFEVGEEFQEAARMAIFRTSLERQGVGVRGRMLKLDSTPGDVPYHGAGMAQLSDMLGSMP